MTTATFVPVEEYLRTSYEPDREYVDGALVERNVGEYDHSVLENIIGAYLRALRQQVPLRAFTEQRIRITGKSGEVRYRIPDVCVMPPGHARTPVLAEPPVLIVEILSPDDRMSDVLQKIGEYVRFGVGTIWIVDPAERKLFTADDAGLHEMKDRIGRFQCAGADLAVDFNAIFAELDEI